MSDLLPFVISGLAIGAVYGLAVTTVSLAVVAALYVLFRRSRVGVTMRAVVDDPDLVGLTGTSPARVRRGAWVIGAVLAALSGVLVLPLVGLEPIGLTFLVVE